MNKELYKKVSEKVTEIYGPLNSEDFLVLVGSRAFGFGEKNSDIDTMVFTNIYDFYKKVSFEKGFRTADEDAGCEIRIDYLDQEVLLEVKFSEKIIENNIINMHNIANSKLILGNKKEYESFLEKNICVFKSDYEKNLMKEYIGFFDEFKQLKGMFEKQKSEMDFPIFVKKGVVLEKLMRLFLLIHEMPYPTCKWLLKTIQKSGNSKQILEILDSVKEVLTIEKFLIIEKKLKEYINGIMPNKNYVGCWWKFLKEYRKL